MSNEQGLLSSKPASCNRVSSLSQKLPAHCAKPQPPLLSECGSRSSYSSEYPQCHSTRLASTRLALRYTFQPCNCLCHVICRDDVPLNASYCSDHTLQLASMQVNSESESDSASALPGSSIQQCGALTIILSGRHVHTDALFDTWECRHIHAPQIELSL